MLGRVGGIALAQDDGSRLPFHQATCAARTELRRSAGRFQHVIVDERSPTLRTQAAYRECFALRREGIGVNEMVPATAAAFGLAHGRQFVLARGGDASGAAGTPNAAFPTVTAS